jgi:hypothetical protein
MSRVDGVGSCEHCGYAFPYYLIHNGFNDSSFAYCERCGRLALLSRLELENGLGRALDVLLPLPLEAERLLRPCDCGGAFRWQAPARCPSCREPLSADMAAEWIERNATGTKAGWQWQRTWDGLYALAIVGRVVFDPFASTVGVG